MRQSRFADEQMVAIVREADREPVADVAKRHGVSEQTIYVWRKRFGTLAASEVRRLTGALPGATGRAAAACGAVDCAFELSICNQHVDAPGALRYS